MNASDITIVALTAVIAVFVFVSMVMIYQQIKRDDDLSEDLERERRDGVRYRVGAAILHAQLKHEGLAPVWEPPINGDPPKGDKIVTTLVQHFDMAELEMLAYDIGVQWEGLGGEALPVRAIRLVEYARRRGLEHELRAAIKRARPNVEI